MNDEPNSMVYLESLLEGCLPHIDDYAFWRRIVRTLDHDCDLIVPDRFIVRDEPPPPPTDEMKVLARFYDIAKANTAPPVVDFIRSTFEDWPEVKADLDRYIASFDEDVVDEDVVRMGTITIEEIT